DQFLDERFVDLQPSGGVENQRVAIVLLRIFERAASDFEDVGFALADEDRDFDLLAEGFQLIHGGRTKNVRSHQQRGAALLEEQPGELGAGGGFAGAVQTHHQYAGRVAAQIQAIVGRAQKFDQFVMDDLDDLLAGLDALDDFLAESLGFDAFDEIAGDLEIDIGLQQGEPDLAQGISDIGLGNFAEAAQVLEGILEFAAQRVEHTWYVRPHGAC